MADAAQNEAINTAVSNAAFADLEFFLLGAGDIAGYYEGRGEFKNHPCELDVRYELTLFDRNFVSARFQTMICTGGAGK